MARPIEREARDEFRRHFGFADWPIAAGERVFIRGLRIAGGELPGHRLLTTRTTQMPDDVAALLTVWQPVVMDADRQPMEALVLVDAFECASRDAAAVALLDLLAEFQSPLIERVPEGGPGEVAFGGEGGMAFLRGNLAIRVLVGGPGVDSISQAATDLDNRLVARPDPSQTRLSPEFVRVAAQPATKDRPASLDIEVSDPRDRPVILKLYTASGTVAVVDGRLTFQPDRPGSHQVSVYAVTPEGDAVFREVTLETG